MLAVGLLGTAPAHADWQYTRWGMTSSEVISASNGGVIPAANPDKYEGGKLLHLLDGTYRAAGFDFDAKFIFNPQRKLVQVKLEMPISDAYACSSLWGTMANTYGPPKVSRMTLGKIAKWWDQGNGNVVALSDFPGMWCQLQYSPIMEAGAAGGL